MNQQRRLGRGLEALLGQPLGGLPEGEGFVEQQPEQNSMPMHPSGETVNGITHINVYEIDGNPFQPRREFDDAEIDALAQSIRDHGIIQPMVVRPMNGRFQLIAGERRLLRGHQSRLAQVPTQVREADDRQVAEIAIVENLQRKDLNCAGKSGVVPAVPWHLRMHSGRAGGQAVARSFDGCQPDPTAGTAGSAQASGELRGDFRRPCSGTFTAGR